MSFPDKLPDDLGPTIGLLEAIKARLNYCLSACRSLARMQGAGEIKVFLSQGNIIVDGSALVTQTTTIQSQIDALTERVTTLEYQLANASATVEITGTLDCEADPPALNATGEVEITFPTSP